MAKVKLYLDKRRTNKDGRYPLTISVSHKYKTLLIPTGYHFSKEEWTMIEYTIVQLPQSKWSADAYDVFALRSSYDVALAALGREVDPDDLSITEVRDRLQKIVTGKCKAERKAQERRLFIPRFRHSIEKKDTEGTKRVYTYTLNKILEYDQNAERLCLEDIDKDWLSGFNEFLKPTVSQNIRNLHFRNIRAVFNDAIKDDVTDYYPFRKFKLPKIEETDHRALTIEQLRILRETPCEGWMEEYRDMFMLSFYLIGISAVDLLHLKKSSVSGGRLSYRRAKTHRPYSIKIEPEAQAIINKYKGKDWLLSPLDRYNDYKDYLQHWNRALKRIGMSFPEGKKPEGEPLFPDLSSYWARHSWATAASALDVPVEITARSLGHSWVNKTVTSIYIKFDTKKIDEANRRVIDAVVG